MAVASKTGETQRGDSTANSFAGTDHLSPDQVWDRFIRKNPMIFLVLSGHAYLPAVDGVSLGENLRIDRNDAATPSIRCFRTIRPIRSGRRPGGLGQRRAAG